LVCFGLHSHSLKIFRVYCFSLVFIKPGGLPGGFFEPSQLIKVLVHLFQRYYQDSARPGSVQLLPYCCVPAFGLSFHEEYYFYQVCLHNNLWQSPEIRVSKNSNSAIALEQTLFKSFSQNMPVRIIYHLVKGNDNWLFDFFSISFIPNNEDIGKLNKALE